MKNSKNLHHLTQPEQEEIFNGQRRVIRRFGPTATGRRTPVERLADFLTLKLGSMAFLTLNAFWFISWIAINMDLVPGIAPFDPFPFGLLTMIVSLEAIFLAIIVLISQNRAAKVDDLREEVDLQINTMAEEEITKMLELQVLLLRHQGISVSKDKKLQQMLKPTDKSRIKQSLEKQA